MFIDNNEFLAKLRATRDRNRKELEALADLTGQTVAEVEADVCAPDPGGESKPHYFRLRVDDTNPRHVHFSVFANGAKCGDLCMTVDGYCKFASVLLIGAGRHSKVDASAQTVTGDPGIGEREAA